MTADRFIGEYNAVTADVTRALRMRPRPLNAKVREEATAFLAWASAESVDPVLFMRARHDAAPGARIPITRLHKVSASFLKHYREWGEWKQSKVAEAQRFAATDDLDGDRVLTSLHEAGRAALSGDPLVCMSSLTISGGWHPASPHCQRCEVAKECRAALPRSTRRRRDWGKRAGG